MAAKFSTLGYQFIIISLLYSFVTILVNGNDEFIVRSLDKNFLALKKEKLSHFRVYWHDVVSGPHPTSIPVVRSPLNTTAAFGAIAMIDDPLTMGPELSSKLVGRAQGLYALASQEEVGLLMAMNFVFVEGKYNKSSISILGRNAVFDKVREMPIIGGTGLFRFARGYVQARTHTFTPNTGDAIVEYNVYVLHY